MYKRILSALALAAMLLPAAAGAVSVTTDLKGELIKGSQPAVYFYGEDGKRYVFPNEKIFYTWYTDFSSVREVTDAQLAAIQIGGNVTYRPGTKLVKVTTDPRVYAVSGRGILRWITSEQLAKSIYGDHWAQQVQDLPDAFFQDYLVSNSITSADAYKPEEERSAHASVSNLIKEPEPGEEDHSGSTTTTHAIVLTSTGGNKVAWTDSVVSPSGYKLVWSTNEHPTYPTRDGDHYRYYSESTTRTGEIGDTVVGSTYHVRVCNYVNDRCGSYSNEISITISSNSTATSTHVIVLASTGGKSVSWTDTSSSTSAYKLVWSKNTSPVYPLRVGDLAMYYGSTVHSGTISGDAGNTYYARVCAYVSDQCVAYSNQVTIVIPAETAATSTARVITLASNGGKAFSWTDNATSTGGYKLVWSKNSLPTYPTRTGDSYVYISDPNTKSGSLTGALDAGVTYYVRVCNYINDGCGMYSNQVSVVGTDPVTPVDATSTHLIVLTTASGTSVSWTDTTNALAGYKLVWSLNPNPTYPTRDGDHYVYYSEPTTRMGTIGDTTAGSTYYVRVCQYLGDVCGTYSNQISLTIASTTASGT